MSELRKQVVTGEKNSLVKSDGTPMTTLRVGGGWDTPCDLDFHALELDADGKILSGHHFIAGGASKGAKAYRKSDGSFFDKDPEGALIHSGDCNDQGGEGIDESIMCDLTKVHPNCAKIKFYVTIYDESQPRKLNFGQVDGLFFIAEDPDSGQGWETKDISEEFSTAITVQGLEVYRYNDTWKVAWKPEGLNKSISEILGECGFQAP